MYLKFSFIITEPEAIDATHVIDVNKRKAHKFLISEIEKVCEWETMATFRHQEYQAGIKHTIEVVAFNKRSLHINVVSKLTDMYRSEAITAGDKKELKDILDYLTSYKPC